MSESRSVMNHGKAFQRSIIRLMTIDPVFCAKAVQFLKPANFSGELSWFFGIIQDQYRGGMPTMESLSARILEHKTEKQPEYYKELSEVFAITPHAPEIKRQMTDFCRANIFVETSRKAADLYNSRSHDDAYLLVRERVEELLKIDFESDRNVRFGDGREVAEKMKLQMQNAIKTGIHAIDDAMMGGLYPGTWTTFLGPSNVGKSMLMPNLAYHAVQQQKRVFVTVHEDEMLPTKMRYLSRFSGIPFNTLINGFWNLSAEEQKKFDEADRILKEHVVFQFMYTHDAFVERVADEARSLMRVWRFDLYLCDYGQCLQSRAFKSIESIRLVHEHVYHELKQLCLELDIPGAGGAQVNRQGMVMSRTGADWLRCTDVSEAFGIVKKSNNIITMNRSANAVGENRMVYLLDKVRMGHCPVAVSCVTDYSRCNTHKSDQQQTIPIDKGPEAGAPKEEGQEK